MVGGIWAERGGEIVLATRPQFDQTLPSFRSVVASSVKFELPNTRWSSDRPNPPERDARVSSCLLQVENHMVNAARGVTRSRSRASPRARRGGDRTCGRGSVAGETRTPRGARGIAALRALCVHRTPETSGRETGGTAGAVVMAGSCVDVETSASAPARRPRRDDEPKRIFAIRKRDTPSTSFSSQRWWTTAPTYQVGSHPPHHVVCCVIPGLLPRRRVRSRTRNGPDGESRSTPQTMTAKIPPGGPDAPSATRSSPAPTSPTRIASSRGLSSVSARRSCSISTALGSAASRASTRSRSCWERMCWPLFSAGPPPQLPHAATALGRPWASRRVSVRLRRRTAASLLRTRPASSHTGDGGEARRGAALSRSVPKAPSMWRACPR